MASESLSFFDTDLCRSRSHCAVCRTDAEWRGMLFAAGMVEERDFACPAGFSADRLPRAFRTLVRRTDCRGCAPVEVVFYERSVLVEVDGLSSANG